MESNKIEMSDIQSIQKELRDLQFSVEMLSDRVSGHHKIEMLQMENQRLKIELQLVEIRKRLPPLEK